VPATNTAVPPTLTPTRAPTTAPTVAPSATKPPANTWGPVLAPLTGGKAYNDPNGRFSFSVPTDWVRSDPGNAEVVFNPPDGSANFTVNLDRVQGTMTIDAYNQYVDRQLRTQFGTYTPVSLDKVMVGDHQAYRRVSRVVYQGQTIQSVQVYFIDKNVAHVLTFATLPNDFNRYADTFDGIAGSYKAGE
jgi:hypothetical protein